MDRLKKILFAVAYWAVSLTWGCLMTIPGLLIALVAIALGGKPHRNGCSFIVEIGGNWGGLELGACALCGTYHGTSYWDEIRCHEFGHSIAPQHMLMGPLFPFLVGIPSACRYWYQRILQKRGKTFPNEWYYRFWAEANASSNGTRAINWLEGKSIVNPHEV